VFLFLESSGALTRYILTRQCVVWRRRMVRRNMAVTHRWRCAARDHATAVDKLRCDRGDFRVLEWPRIPIEMDR